MRIEGAPRYHISTLLQTPPAFLVLSSHALCALGRFLIFSKVTTYTFASLLLRFFCSSLVALQLFACRLRFAFSNSKSWWFSTGSEFINSSYHHVASSWRGCYNWILLVEKVCVAFSNFSRVSRFLKEPIRNNFIFPIAKYAWNAICWCHNFNHSTIR